MLSKESGIQLVLNTWQGEDEEKDGGQEIWRSVGGPPSALGSPAQPGWAVSQMATRWRPNPSYFVVGNFFFFFFFL